VTKVFSGADLAEPAGSCPEAWPVRISKVTKVEANRINFALRNVIMVLDLICFSFIILLPAPSTTTAA
jgi:hypothetical protein